MTEEPKKIETVEPEKLLIDDPNNFLFHAAYNTYSELFDSTTTNEAKQDLNENIKSLKENKIDCSTFYMNITRHRDLGRNKHHGRFTLNTQRKRDWRKKSQRQDRIKRHKK
jgi:alpha-glucosidase (family GH31 glycosyl hydrolase)